MERKLVNLFDRQRFEHNAKLAGIVSDVENHYAKALSDDDMELVSAAGEMTDQAEKNQEPGLVGAFMVLEGEKT